MPSTRLLRLSESVLRLDTQFNAHLNFDRDAEHRRIVRGDVSGQVVLECQRCLQPVSVALDGHFTMAVVYNDEMAKALPADIDPLMLLPDEPLVVAELVEDELLLCLPMHAMHDDGECQIQTEFKPDDAEAEQAPVKDNPFKVLESLKRS
ncbi:YceD family protein [Saccharospirillum impatiens]|uniref:YceD family protein n=1 Tax=Saccharospirillum impatiens TaxID=169438 RepID=UPI000412C706|nr:YceD family protein [Saccharospirillum impatiens]